MASGAFVLQTDVGPETVSLCLPFSVSASSSSESIDEDPVSKVETSSPSGDTGKAVSTAKSRRKERRRNSERRNSERQSFSENPGDVDLKGPSISSEMGGNNHRGMKDGDGLRLAAMFERSQEDWMKVGKGSNKRRNLVVSVQEKGVNLQVIGNSEDRVKENGTPSLPPQHIPTEKMPGHKNQMADQQSDGSDNKLPGDGHWLKNGQKVTAVVPTSPTTPVKMSLHVSVHPWNSPPAGSATRGSSLKEIMAAELASQSSQNSGVHQRWSSGSGKKSQNQRRRDSQTKQPAPEPSKPAWGRANPASPPNPPEEDNMKGIQEVSPTARKISFGEMFEVRRSNKVATSKPQIPSPSVSPVSPQSVNPPSSPWGRPDSSRKISEATSPLSFTQILEAEEQAEKNLDKAMHKSLHSIQTEEQAIEELLQMYQASANHEEFITVERVKVKMARPHWAKGVT